MALGRHEGELAIVWIDAHADFNTPASSPSGAFHGTVLRSLTSVGPEGLTPPVPAVLSSLVLAGTRSTDAAEQDQLTAAGVKPLGMRAMAELASVADQLNRQRRIHHHAMGLSAALKRPPLVAKTPPQASRTEHLLQISR